MRTGLLHKTREQDDDKQQAQENVFRTSLDTILAETRGVKGRAGCHSRKPRSKEIPSHLAGRMDATMAYVSLDLDQTKECPQGEYF